MRFLSIKLILLVIIILDAGELESAPKVPEMHLELKYNKQSLLPCECYKVTLSLLVHKRNPHYLEFYELKEQLPIMRERLIPEDAWSYDYKIKVVKREHYSKNGEPYDRYRLIQSIICPYKEGLINQPDISLYLKKYENARKEKFSIVDVHSLPSAIHVNQLPDDIKNTIYKNDKYYMVGDFVIYEDDFDPRKARRVGDTISYIIRLASRGGISFPVHLNNVNNPRVNIWVDDLIEKDSIRLGVLNYSKEYHLKMVAKQKGKLTLSDYIYWTYYSPRDKRIYRVQPSAVFNISKNSKGSENLSEEITYDRVLALDVSESMLINDYYPNRLGKGLEIVNLLLDKNCNTPLVVFAGRSKVINDCRVGPEIRNRVNQNGTAIGEAIYKSVQLLKNIESPNKSIIIIGDGDNTAGCISETSAARLAKSHGIKIISLGIGTMGRVPFGYDSMNHVRYVEDVYNDKSLRQIAEITDGKFVYVDKLRIMEKLLSDF